MNSAPNTRLVSARASATTISSRRPNIADAVRAGHVAHWNALFDGTEMSSSEKRRAAKYLLDPLWRPLCEVEANDFTSYECALLLIGAGFAEVRTFSVRVGAASGNPIDYIELTRSGLEQVSAFAGPLTEGNNFAASLIDAVQAYAAIDTGHGVVPTRNGAEAAIEMDDWFLMRRFRSLKADYFPMRNVGRDDLLLDEERQEYMDGLSAWGETRTGSAVICIDPST